MAERSVIAPRVDSAAKRITYIDGLRGLAIGWVLIHHAWGYHYLWTYFATPHKPSPFDLVANVGAQGVSLFLVVSGFCLSYPLLQRRQAGAPGWFKPSVFFARRCLRILPSYYVALGLSAIFLVALGRHASALDFGGAPNVPNLLSHIFLIHNLTPFSTAINGVFWSLGLEWQWYWVFPVVLLAMVRAPRVTLAGCFIMAIGWEVALHPLTNLFTAHGVPDLLGRGVLPVRLFEFACGILAAQLIVDRRLPPRPLLWLGLAPLAFVIADHNFYDYHRWIEQPVFGMSFAALLLLGHGSTPVNRLLSWRPLVALGVMSYSVYLVHLPAVEFVDRLSPLWLRQSPLVMVVAACAGLTVGAIFHLLVERPCMQPAAWKRVSPFLLPLFAWTDRVMSRGTSSDQPKPAEPSPAVGVPASAALPGPAQQLGIPAQSPATPS